MLYCVGCLFFIIIIIIFSGDYFTLVPTTAPTGIPTTIPTEMPTHVNCENEFEDDESVLLTIQIGLDYWAVAYNETSWQLSSLTDDDLSNKDLIIINDNGALYDINDTVVEYEMCLLKPLRKNDDITKCYLFELFDKWGDGLDDAKAARDGSNVLIYLNNYLVDKSDWNDGFYKEIEFCIS